MKKDRVVARIGLSTRIPPLVVGEMGWDVDTKVFRVGDDTTIPAKVMTHKSVGSFSYPNVDLVEYKEIRTIGPQGTVDGVNLKELRSRYGLLAYGYETSGETRTQGLRHRQIESDEYLTVDHPDGSTGNPKIKVSLKLMELIERLGGAGGFSFGELPPDDANPGHLFWSTLDQLIYILVTDSATDSSRRWWIDIGGAGGGGSGDANRTWIGKEPPKTALIGDSFLHSEDEYRRYLLVRDKASIYWREVRI